MPPTFQSRLPVVSNFCRRWAGRQGSVMESQPASQPAVRKRQGPRAVHRHAAYTSVHVATSCGRRERLALTTTLALAPTLPVAYLRGALATSRFGRGAEGRARTL